jgi:hypothetical protein
MSQAQAIHYIQHHSLTGIKAGQERPHFLDIWMVVVEGRIFARSWGLSANSWYHTFLKHPQGAIRCGEQEFAIEARVPSDLEQLTPAINQAYLSKYNSEHNRSYAQGIVQAPHTAHTMEFIVIAK